MKFLYFKSMDLYKHWGGVNNNLSRLYRLDSAITYIEIDYSKDKGLWFQASDDEDLPNAAKIINKPVVFKKVT